MSRLRIQGNPDGGIGQVALRPAITEIDTELLIPAVGAQVATADSAGMPQLVDGTPVVESGSNTDGEWTKFADGTQQCSALSNSLLTTSNGSGSVFFANETLTFPLSFFETPTVSPIASRNSGIIWAGFFDETSTNVGLRVLGSTSASAGYAGFIATGRWK